MSCSFPWSQVGTSGSASRPLACGQCIGCRLERSRQWAVRCMHESQLHDFNVFVTLTYSDEHLPEHCSLHYPDFQFFMRKLRLTGRRVRFFMGGEYGEETGRPHYHAILFGCHFPDMFYWRKSETGFSVYRSAELESLWTLGNSEIGTVTFESAAYCAKYCVKKMTGALAAGYGLRVPEFGRMSLKPGIGSVWFDRFGKSDVLADGKVVVNGVKCGAPKYYRNKIRDAFPFRAKELASDGHTKIIDVIRSGEMLDSRLAAQEAVLSAGLTKGRV